MGGILKITEVGGKSWELILLPNTVYSIGRAKDNDIVLNDQRVSRRHAQIRSGENEWTLVDGYYVDGELKRSVNRVFVNGLPQFEKILESS
ncbi:MAG TPA: FHA domain-containing protein, partial [Pyrinomonadaceae bacterium]